MTVSFIHEKFHWIVTVGAYGVRPCNFVTSAACTTAAVITVYLLFCLATTTA